MPRLGAGTQFGFSEDGNGRGALAKATDYVAMALRAGFRVLDTARGYGTEEHVVPGIAAAGLRREEVFVVTKAWVGVDCEPGRAEARAAIAQSAQRLGGYVDLFLVHQPVPGWQDLWRALEDSKDEGVVRAIGVSNFGLEHLEELASFAQHRPSVNQIHLHPFVYEHHAHVVRACHEHGVLIMAFPRSPWRLGEGSAIDEIARQTGRSRAQVMLRWALDRGFAVIPLSTNPEHLAENFAVREFTLNAEQVRRIDAIAERPRVRFSVDRVDAQGVSGWAFAPGGLARVDVLRGDTAIGHARSGLPRPDVQQAHGGDEAALASGFEFRFPDGCFGDGPREVRLAFVPNDGETAQSNALPVPR